MKKNQKLIEVTATTRWRLGRLDFDKKIDLSKAQTSVGEGWPSRKEVGQKAQTPAEGHRLAPFREWVTGLVSGSCPSLPTSSS